MKIIITGTTGMVGKGVLLECLDSPLVSEILSISRRSVGFDHDKLTEVIHKDFLDFDPIKNKLGGFDACFYCMGVSVAGKSEDEYKKITYDTTLGLAKILVNMDANLVFNFVSGEGTNSSEKGRAMWARVKGKTENDLLSLGFKRAFMFRPGVIVPLRGIKSSTKSYQFVYDYFLWLIKIIKWLFPRSVVNTTQIGQAMIKVVQDGYDKSILRPSDILRASS